LHQRRPAFRAEVLAGNDQPIAPTIDGQRLWSGLLRSGGVNRKRRQTRQDDAENVHL
jgi:hypothetical protein